MDHWWFRGSNQCQICAVKTMSLSARYSTKFPWQLHNPFCTLAFEYMKLYEIVRLMVASHDHKVYKMSQQNLMVNHIHLEWIGLLIGSTVSPIGDTLVRCLGWPIECPYRSPSSWSSLFCFIHDLWDMDKCKDLAKNWAKRGETMYFFPGE